MAKKATSSKSKSPSKIQLRFQELNANWKEIAGDPTVKVFTAVLFIFLGLFTLVSSLSFMANWSKDFTLQWSSSIDDHTGIGNVFGLLGHKLGWTFIMRGFGLSALVFPLWFMAVGARNAFALHRIKPAKLLLHMIFFALIGSTLIAWVVPAHPTLWSGLSGHYIYHHMAIIVGHMGVALIGFVALLLYVVVARQLETLRLPKKQKAEESPEEELEPEEHIIEFNNEDEEEPWAPEPTAVEVDEEPLPEPEIVIPTPAPTPVDTNTDEQDEDTIDVQVEVHQELVEDDKAINKKVKDFGEYDPTLDLSRFQLPKIDLLQQYGDGQITFDKDEIEANKNRIVETLQNYNIEIKEIKATIGPTVTLYEIVPAAGIRISKIKNLEDDIALSLAALGIRIIAPIPGKGTIGIEVPNANAQMVSMRQVIASKKFQEAKMELPVAMGRTITNENFIFDLAKMPHLLMAGATGQGKSVGLNAILTSLLYKKHPSQLKFVLVDPKKVELTLYNKIERHYLAILPDSDEAIITDTTKVINTLNSLCIEMDNRYELLKSAMVRNIKEYNAKFISRRLNPEEGHKYLPYIVLVIDEFADLIMTAGKEVEMPIARLAQLARAIGIHLIVATQRPSVNVITGIIKANFPARAAFRVTSKIDSRTILDAGGADQLIGKGDMLFSQGSDLVRLQCAFVDTPEVEEICDFIGNQQAYPTAYQLPEYVGEEGGGVGDIDPSERDALFEDAARLVVATQQGSTSMIQRKLKLGYNRAGRIVDQLEAAGILGPFEGSKARQVLVPDEMALEQKLNGDA
ncbi:MAG: DNA translocase FtsK 4TM domain-containing protein [Schleiferiaceae bacterium]|jgi:DNA segregation ATPase FtsK/SpoIIIE, S-DNA-T family